MNFYKLKISINNLLKNKLVSIINISGLALGITICLLTLSYVKKEKTIDQYLPNIENAYAISNFEGANISAPMVEHIRKEIPEIDHLTFAQYEWSPQIFLKKGDVSYKIDKLLLTDTSFFKVFQFESLYGDLQSALSVKNQIVLTQSLAEKIFGKINPVGRTLVYNATELQNVIVEIGAVIKDLPHHSSWEFEAVLTMETNEKISWFTNSLKYWGAQNFSAFLSIPNQVSSKVVREKLKNISLSNVPENTKDNIRFDIIPFTDCYCHFHDLDLIKHGNHLTLTIVQITGLLILLLAWINFINLVTAQKLKRLKNIGILKVLGSKRGKVIQLVFSESALILSLSVILVFALSYFLVGGLNQLTNSQFTLSEIFSGWNLGIFVSILLLTLLTTGILPGISMGKNQTTLLLKSTVNGNNKNLIRNSLLVFQFCISIVLLISVIFINKQNNYLSKLDPGFQRENILYTSTNKDIRRNIHVFKSEVDKIPGISEVCYSSSLLGYNQMNSGTTIINKGTDQQIYYSNFYVSSNFFHFFGIDLLRGETFTENSVKNKDRIFNHSAIREFQINQLADARISYTNPAYGNIIGEVEDFNFESMHVPIRPAGFQCSGDVDEVAYIKINSPNGKAFEECLQALEKVWNELSPDFPLEIKFMDQKWEELYKKEKQFQVILNYSTIISIILSCLGLISLTFFMVETQTKEIGLRKVNGAKSFEIITMLNKNLIKWIAIAFVLACPIAWYSLELWLENFAYKAELSWWIFALAGIIALGVALLTVSWQSWRAARRNPVESLRYE